METVFLAFDSAALVWARSVEQVGWPHVMFALAYGAAAWLCFMNSHLAQQADEPAAPWRAAMWVMAALGINMVLRLDMFGTELLRETSKIQLWYDKRRDIQFEILLALLVVGIWLLAKLGRSFTASGLPPDTVAAGVLLLVFLLGMRAVSWHFTDGLLNERVLWVSLGRWFELFGIGLVIHGARQSLRFR